VQGRTPMRSIGNFKLQETSSKQITNSNFQNNKRRIFVWNFRVLDIVCLPAADREFDYWLLELPLLRSGGYRLSPQVISGLDK